MNNLTLANKLFRDNHLQAAAEVYKSISENDSVMAAMAKMNLDIIGRRLTGSPTSNTINFNVGKSSPKKSLASIYKDVSNNVDIEEFLKDSKECPLVSVIVTAHNTQEYIEACIESLVAQTYPNKEIIVVDDTSSDLTPAIVSRLARTYKSVKYKRLNSNLGTYYAKNYGIQESSGEIVFFQDSDDISHPWRLSILVAELLRTDKDVVRGSYSRIDADRDEVIEVNGLVKKLGLITLGVRKTVFEKIGYFNCTTKASDDEFFHRVQKYIGRDRVVNNELPLYFNTYREDSLFADMVSMMSDGSIQQKPSVSRMNYLENFKKIHAASDVDSIKRRFRFPKIRDAVSVLPDMTKLANPTSRVVVNVCSIPSRENIFRKTINSVIDQCDEINVYLDGYKKVPDFLVKYKDKCRVINSSAMPNLRDNGKFIRLEELVRDGVDAYYLTIDDDIVYPVDYVNSIVKTIDAFKKKCAIGVHGVILKDYPSGYFSDKRIVYNFTKALEVHRSVNILGTGTLGFHTCLFKGLNLEVFKQSGMADIFFAIYCKENIIPMIAISRHDGWLFDMNPSAEVSLYHEFKENDSIQAEFIKANSPWGLCGISAVNDLVADVELQAMLQKSMIKLQSLTR
jgi:glycosyltransferase involved in cell wall biosynthesis